MPAKLTDKPLDSIAQSNVRSYACGQIYRQEIV